MTCQPEPLGADRDESATVLAFPLPIDRPSADLSALADVVVLHTSGRAS